MERKLKEIREVFLKEIVDYCSQHDIKSKPVAQKYSEFSIKQPKSHTSQITLELYKHRLTIQEIAVKRGLTLSTVISHLERLILDGEDISLDSIVSPEKQQRIKQVFMESDTELLTPVKEKLGDDYSYEEIRLVRAKMMHDYEKSCIEF